MVQAAQSQSQQVAAAWDERVLGTHSTPHFMQSSTWEAVRSRGPWHVHRRGLGTQRDYPVLVFERLVPGYGLFQHLPRVSGLEPADVGPLTERVRDERGTAFATKIEVHQPREEALVEAFLAHGWLPAKASQYRHTVVVDTSASEEEILANMKKRARAEIRVAERHGVEVRRVELDAANRARMIDLVRETEERSGAYFRGDDYLEAVWETFAADDRGRLYFARYGDEVVAGAFIARYGPNAWYKDGGSTREHPQVMASRLLQWRIICDLASNGVVRYDLGHVPPPGEPDAPGRGILVFKSAFARQVLEYMPAFQLSHEERGEAWRQGEGEFLAAYRARTGDDWY